MNVFCVGSRKSCSHDGRAEKVTKFTNRRIRVSKQAKSISRGHCVARVFPSARREMTGFHVLASVIEPFFLF